MRYEDLVPVHRFLNQQLEYLKSRLEDFTYRFEDLATCGRFYHVGTELDYQTRSSYNEYSYNQPLVASAYLLTDPGPWEDAPEGVTLTLDPLLSDPCHTNTTDYISKKEHPTSASVQEQFQTAKHALEHGLESEGTRQHVTRCLVTYMMLELELSKPQAKKNIKSWIREKHNGKSKDWSAGPRRQQKILEDIDRLVDKWKRKINKEVSSQTLTVDEIRDIHQLDAKLQEKEWIAKFYSKVKSILRQQPSEPVELPHSWFQRIWRCAAGTATNRVKALRQLGILELYTNYSDKAHGRIWNVHKVTSEIGLYHSFEEGLLTLLSRKELKQSYTDAQLRRLRKKIRSTPATTTAPLEEKQQDKVA